MRAITYEVKLGTYFLGKVLGGRFPALYHGPLSGLRFQEVPAPGLRGDAWAVVGVTYAGICGSDMAAVTYKSSPALTPFTSFPSVLGHEIVGRVLEAGPDAGVAVGDRVVVEPFLTCATRGQAVACEACREGHYCVCHMTAEGPMAPGMLMGACRDHPGGWAERVMAHRSQLFKLPETLSDELGVLVEPLSVGMHAVLRRRPEPGSRVLVIGSGMMAYAVLVALRLLEVGAHVTHLSQLPFQQEMGRRLGADETLCLADGGSIVERVAAITGARRYRPLLGREVLSGGFDVVFDCVGSEQSLQDAFTYTKARGAIVLVGAPGELAGLDWTFVWQRELTLLGSLGYGVEEVAGERIRTFDLTLRLLQETDLPLADLITHRFGLEQYPEALTANLERARYRSLKTVFVPAGTP